MRQENQTLKVMPLHADDRNPALAHVTFDPDTGGDLQFIGIPKDKIRDVIVALESTLAALAQGHSVESAVKWRDPYHVEDI